MSTTVILGSGIIGVSTAYYLAEHQPPSSIHLVEPSPELFASASGYAGGFLARDWFGPAVSSLGALSFDLHQKLAEKQDGRAKWGYAPTTCFDYTGSSAGPESDGRAKAAPDAPIDDHVGATPAWLRRRAGDQLESIGGKGTTAQVEPKRLAQYLLQQCLDRGVRLHHPAQAISVGRDMRNEVSSVRIADLTSSTETDIPSTRIIIAAGAWSPQVFKSLFRSSDIVLPISSLAGHSLLIKSPRWAEAMEEKGLHSIYTTSPAGHCLEIYAWIGERLFLCGVNSADIPLPRLATGSKIIKSSIEELEQAAAELLASETGDRDYEIVRQGLCFRPVTPWGTPIVVRVPDEHLGVAVGTRPGAEGGVYVAAGHGPWGISLSLGTGKVLAELAQGRELSADISHLGLRI